MDCALHPSNFSHYHLSHSDRPCSVLVTILEIHNFSSAKILGNFLQFYYSVYLVSFFERSLFLPVLVIFLHLSDQRPLNFPFLALKLLGIFLSGLFGLFFVFLNKFFAHDKVRLWLPRVQLDIWRLHVPGPVDQELSLTL